MPRQKSMKTIFVETVLFMSLIALVGHLSVNFWERYVIQSELSKMRYSLHTLKDTINHIGVAYNQLHKELQGLADIAEKETLKESLLSDKHEHTHTALAQKLLKDIHVEALLDSGLKIENIGKLNTQTQTVANKDTQISYSDVAEDASNKKDKNVGVGLGYDHKKVQHMHVKTMQSKSNKHVATSTLNPRISSAAGTGNKEFVDPSRAYTTNNKNKRQKRARTHKCYDNNHCTVEEIAEHDRPSDYTKF